MVIRKKSRIAIREIQRLLGLQIWISTVFRVTRQFLTSICDILRNAGRSSFFYPRKYPVLVKRLLFDLKFWRRFVTNNPHTAFKYAMGRLPINEVILSSDASTAYGMAGVLMFGRENKDYPGLDGLFWQVSWAE